MRAIFVQTVYTRNPNHSFAFIILLILEFCYMCAIVIFICHYAKRTKNFNCRPISSFSHLVICHGNKWALIQVNFIYVTYLPSELQKQLRICLQDIIMMKCTSAIWQWQLLQYTPPFFELLVIFSDYLTTCVTKTGTKIFFRSLYSVLLINVNNILLLH